MAASTRWIANMDHCFVGVGALKDEAAVMLNGADTK